MSPRDLCIPRAARVADPPAPVALDPAEVNARATWLCLQPSLRSRFCEVAGLPAGVGDKRFDQLTADERATLATVAAEFAAVEGDFLGAAAWGLMQL